MLISKYRVISPLIGLGTSLLNPIKLDYSAVYPAS